MWMSAAWLWRILVIQVGVLADLNVAASHESSTDPVHLWGVDPHDNTGGFPWARLNTEPSGHIVSVSGFEGVNVIWLKVWVLISAPGEGFYYCHVLS